MQNSENLPKKKTFVTDSYLPFHLQQSLARYSDVSVKNCASSESFDYVLSLTIKGEYAACTQYAELCVNLPEIETSLPTIIQGARCAALDYQYRKAFDIFTKGLNSQHFKGEDSSAYILEFASLARYSSFAEQTEKIIALHPTWTADEKSLALGLVEMTSANPLKVTKKQVFDFVEQQLLHASGFYQLYLKKLRISLFAGDYQTQKAYELLVQDAIHFVNPLDWWGPGFSILYAMADGFDFTAASNFYKAFLPFANTQSVLPRENNVYTYTQISSDICKNTMLQGPDLTAFRRQVLNWKNGKLALAQLLKNFEALPKRFFEKSDFLSTYASLLAISTNYTAAEQNYWKAHLQCAFNNRAHWGLALLARRKKYQSFPEYKANEDFVVNTLKKINFPEETKTYFNNWDSLPAESQTRVKFAARIWAPFLKQMLATGSRAYIKLPFEVLSEAPGLSSMKDARIGPPTMPNYRFDNRLWDDVRGVGGRSVAADHDEVFQTVQGDYNLLGHEMAHQFHAYTAKAAPELYRCIDRLYAAALERDQFSDGYAKSVVTEYFAQGITYYLISAHFPARYGTNVTWFQKNDPLFYNFMTSIDNSKGDLNKIVCPIAAK